MASRTLTARLLGAMASLRRSLPPFLLPFLAAMPLAATAAPSVEPYHPAFHTDETVLILFQGGPGNSKDWIGVFPAGVDPAIDQNAWIWAYVDGTQNGLVGFTEGSVALTGGLPTAGNWTAYLLLDDTFTILASTTFQVVDRTQPLIRAAQRTVNARDPVRISFSGTPGNPKDWMGIYPQGQAPGSATPAARLYLDGTSTGDLGLIEGTVVFSSGLRQPGRYDVHLFLNDTLEVLASTAVEILPGVSVPPSLVSVTPTNGTVGLPPRLTFSAVFTNGTSVIVPNSVTLRLDGQPVSATVTGGADTVSVAYTHLPLPASGPHTWILTAQDDSSPPLQLDAQVTVEVAPYRDIRLPDPIYFLDFDAVPEGSLPPGWTQHGHSEPRSTAQDFGDLASAAYARWTAVEASRFQGLFALYGDSAIRSEVYQRVLFANPFNVLNGQVYDQPLGKGRVLFANSGYQTREGAQVLHLVTSDFNLAGRTGVHLGFKSLWEQNEDSLAAIEYSINGGSTWLPVAYFLDSSRVVTRPDPVTGAPAIDAIATFATPHQDVASYFDDSGNRIGGRFGAFIGAPVTGALAPFIHARLDDDPTESKRIELFPLPEADNQPAVRFRFTHAGADSWYFGVDDFGLYAMGGTPGGAPSLQVARDTDGIVLSWPAGATGFVLETSPRVGLGAAAWSPVAGVSGNSHRAPLAGAAAFYRLRAAN